MREKVYEEVGSFILIGSQQNWSLFRVFLGLEYFVRAVWQELSVNNWNEWHCTDSIDNRTYEKRFLTIVCFSHTNY